MKKYIVLVFLACFCISATLLETNDSKKYFDEGMTQMVAKDYMMAIASFTNAISEKANYKEAYYERALAKEKLASSIGYQSTEPCQDFAQALNLGETRSMAMLKKYCMKDCFDMSNAFFQPEIVFCADFSSKVLHDMPSDAYNKLIYLTKLNLFNNRFTEIPPGFIDFNLLIKLDLSSNRLVKVNNMIGSLGYLQELNLSKNYIKSIDIGISGLKHLEKLNLKRNKLSAMPEAIMKLEKLKTLNLSDNLLVAMPEDIGKMKSLKSLILRGNVIPKKEQKRIVVALPNCKVYFDE